MLWFLRHMRETGTGLPGMIAARYVNASPTGLTSDLKISALVLTIWIVTEVAARRTSLALICIPATFGIGVSGGLPLYLLLRSRTA